MGHFRFRRTIKIAPGVRLNIGKTGVSTSVGVRGVSLLIVTWLLGTLAHAALAVETARLAERLAGRAAAVGAARHRPLASPDPA